ncbi:acyl-CoA dehydrogenase family protein [Iamia majanohamensis]|uniref:Acyl-CoA dehydrogenase family protein n=1 Tax=Iamia majanohamensis TaxID=467976 RepID=A0AAF0BR72_9ACTN|nr:acyl-CoA dehydrogenase family protein [Iamia majanohamensis]WCO66126.1 acyl-CoA dehydrogenase family protein [Iamia majanohamensis]
MDVEESAEEAAFRAEARAWLDAHETCDEAVAVRRRPGEDDGAFVERARPWQALLAEEGWAGITWPTEYGGRGGTPAQAAIFTEEAAHRGLPTGSFAVGVGMAGPTIIAHGTDTQKQRYLSPMLRGDEVWCQLFSEPGAGSDLAGLSTRAVRDGDEWVVEGQKVWTSGAHYSDHGILLARTDLDAPKHRGITYFLIDMHQPGIEIRPLRQITGASHFSEVFLTQARVPHDAVLGEVGGGWGVAMTTLANERTFMGGHSSGPGLDDLLALGRTTGAAADPRFRQGLAAAYSRAQVMRYLGLRARTAAAQGRPPGPETSVMKLMAAWNMKRNAELALAMQGPSGMLADGVAPEGGRWQQHFLSAPSIRIAGGSDEIQRNVMGERVLGLPPEARVDKAVPFRELARGPGRG